MTENEQRIFDWQTGELVGTQKLFADQRQKYLKLVEAAQDFINKTQEESKKHGHNRMFAPDEYVELLKAVNEAWR
jgi:hypothetical protein